MADFPSIRIRGVYSTALTRLFLESGWNVVSPSSVIAERFEEAGLPAEAGRILRQENAEVGVKDQDDRQGIVLEGEPDATKRTADFLLRVLPDPVRRIRGNTTMIEFPGASKSVLDAIRRRTVPTAAGHHRLRLIDSGRLDRAERQQLSDQPEQHDEVGRELENELVWRHYRTGNQILMEHGKPDGRRIILGRGEIVDADQGAGRIVVRRRFSGRGRYDGLDIPKQDGDYAETEILAGEWSYHHGYYRRSGKRIGRYYNVNTPVELYPDRIRYVDLEVDVIRFEDGTAEIIDRKDLEQAAGKGYLGSELVNRALGIAEDLLQRARDGRLP